MAGAGHIISAIVAAVLVFSSQAIAATAGTQQQDLLTIVKNKKSDAVIVLAPNAGRYERQGAYDLACYIKPELNSRLS